MNIGGVDAIGDRTDVVLTGFSRALRAAGLPITPDRNAAFLTAAAHVQVTDRDGVYWAGRATLCSEGDQTARYDRVFDAWFSGPHPTAGPVQVPHRSVSLVPVAEASQSGRSDEADDEENPILPLTASESEILRHRDVAELDASERRAMAAALASLNPAMPIRRARRRQPWSSGEVDLRRTLRDQMRNAGELGPVLRRRPTKRARRVVLLVDVSGSMRPYTEFLLRLSHRLMLAGRDQQCAVEVFTIGTRLTRITRSLQLRDPEAALTAAGAQVPDWSGGTRLGEVLDAFVRRWGRRGTARGAVVVICSDGWERGDPVLLAEQVRQIHGLARRLIWLNPHAGKSGYLPVQGGIAAVLPHIDDLLAGHSLETYERLLGVVADA